MGLKEYNMCKKCSYGCCEKRAKDTVYDLWKRICGFKRDEIIMFGYGAMISLEDLERLFECSESGVE
jgi:hypothetical protein